MDVQLICDPPARGPWNMALDEALLEWAARTGGSCLRFYQWSPATLSLGYFQEHQTRSCHPSSCPIPLVRRASGGGAIIHDQELTYSTVVPVCNRFATTAQSLVTTVHQSLIEVLKKRGIPARMTGQTVSRSREEEPFLCFQRRAAEDVLIGDFKVAGSAQRRHRRAILQHGSILISVSEFAAELPGITQVMGTEISLDWLRSELIYHLAQRLDWSFQPWTPDKKLLGRASWWEMQRFGCSSWNEKR